MVTPLAPRLIIAAKKLIGKPANAGLLHHASRGDQRATTRLQQCSKVARNTRGGKPLDSHARARSGLWCARHPPHTLGMASSPMRRLRKTAAVDQDGSVVTIPRLPPVAGTDKPAGWDRWSDAEKVQHLLGLSLDRMFDYLSWPPDNLDPHRLAAQAQVVRVVAMVAAKVGVEARRSPEREQALQALIRDLPDRFKPKPPG